MLNNPTHFRLYLQRELLDRCKRNPKYSLRSFARFFELEPSALSKILSGKRNITRHSFSQMAQRLDLTPDMIAKYSETIRENRGRAPEPKSSIIQYEQVSMDHFQVISDWYHFAILELIATYDFKPNHRSIASRLGISVNEVNSAVERLVRLGFLRIDSQGNWSDRSGDITTVGYQSSHAALKRSQIQVLEKARDAVENIPLQRRDQSTMTMAIASELLPEAKKRITKFRRELCAFLQNNQKKDHVYLLSVSLYPVTQEIKKRSTKNE